MGPEPRMVFKLTQLKGEDMIFELGVLAIMVVGFLVMFRVIPLNKIMDWLFGIILFTILVPVAWAYLQNAMVKLDTWQYPFWVYFLGLFTLLLTLRLFFNFLFPWRRR